MEFTKKRISGETSRGLAKVFLKTNILSFHTNCIHSQYAICRYTLGPIDGGQKSQREEIPIFSDIILVNGICSVSA